jgi:hypothetical protein
MAYFWAGEWREHTTTNSRAIGLPSMESGGLAYPEPRRAAAFAPAAGHRMRPSKTHMSQPYLCRSALGELAVTPTISLAPKIVIPSPPQFGGRGTCFSPLRGGGLNSPHITSRTLNGLQPLKKARCRWGADL